VFSLAKSERKGLDAGIKEFNLKGHVFDRSLLPNELVHPWQSNLAQAIGAGIGSRRKFSFRSWTSMVAVARYAGTAVAA